MATTVEEARMAAESRNHTYSRANGPLLVATDGSEAADGAIRAAHEIALRTQRPVELLAVHAPLPVVSPEVQVTLGPSSEMESRAHLREQVTQQLARVGLNDDWTLDVASGDPAATIVKFAERLGASLVVMGLGGHGLFDRILGDEMVLRVLRLGTVPVLAVSPRFAGFRNVVAAVDFTPSSVRAVGIAGELMSVDGKIMLAHVASEDRDESAQSPSAPNQGTIGLGFDLLTADVGFDRRQRVQRKVLGGDPAERLLEYSKTVSPDLIVAGSHGRGFLSRLLLGSVSQQLVRGATCSVLVAPPTEGPSYLNELPRATSRFATYAWAEQLEEFTRRNSGRTAVLEVIDPELGAQVEQKGLSLAGVSFDPRDGRVYIMFGSPQNGAPHLTHGIAAPTGLQVLRDRAGKDLVLRVAHGRGQTLLTLER